MRIKSILKAVVSEYHPDKVWPPKEEEYPLTASLVRLFESCWNMNSEYEDEVEEAMYNYSDRLEKVAKIVEESGFNERSKTV